MKEKKQKVRVEITPEIRALFDEYHAETEKEVTRYIGAVTEDFQGKVSAIAEQFSSLHEKIDQVKETLDEHTETLDEHSRMLNMHTEMIGTIMEDVAEMKEELRTKADENDLGLLSNRITILEHKIA